MIKTHKINSVLFSAAFLLILSQPAYAYIGPGAGAGAIIVTIALVTGLLLLVVGLVWFPLKRLIKGKSGSGSGADKTSEK